MIRANLLASLVAMTGLGAAQAAAQTPPPFKVGVATRAIVPVGSSARFYAAHIPHAELTTFPPDVGHYVFVADCTKAGRTILPALCIDAPGIDRDAINAQTVHLAEAFFARRQT